MSSSPVAGSQSADEKPAMADAPEVKQEAQTPHTEEHVVEHEIDEAEARRIRRKIDFRLMPLLILLYTLAFLDRVNIGNARLWNMEKDLDMDGYDYNIAVLVFYIPYILLGVPSNMILTRARPRYWIGGLTLCWGLCVTFVGFSKSMGGVIAARVFLGIFEAGVFPACMYLINTWYRRHELATRMAWFMVANDIAGTFSGLLGAGVGSLDGTGGYSGWSWIFFVEGGATVVAAVVACFFLLDFPDKSDFLPPHEREWLLNRLASDDGRKAPEKMTFRGVLDALKDWKVLMSGVLFLVACVNSYSISVFSPTILSTFGWGSIKANLLSAPIRVAAGIAAVTVGISSDKLRFRGPFVVVGFTVAFIGNFCVMLLKNGNVRYMGLYFVGVGVMSVQPLVIGWAANQVVGANKRGTSTAVGGSSGQIGGIISALAFPKSDAPQYVTGASINIAFCVAGVIAACWLSGWARWENRQRDMGRRDHLRELPEEERDNLGEKHPDFRFTP